MRDPTTVADCGTGGGGTGNLSGQAWQYVATGAEGDAFTVTLPTPNANANYIIEATGGGLAAFLLFDTDTYTANDFRLKCSAAPTAGDVINLLLVEKT